MYTILHIYTDTFMHLCARSQTEAICDTFVGHHCMGTQEFEAMVCGSPLYGTPYMNDRFVVHAANFSHGT